MEILNPDGRDQIPICRDRSVHGPSSSARSFTAAHEIPHKHRFRMRCFARGALKDTAGDLWTAAASPVNGAWSARWSFTAHDPVGTAHEIPRTHRFRTRCFARGALKDTAGVLVNGSGKPRERGLVGKVVVYGPRPRRDRARNSPHASFSHAVFCTRCPKGHRW